MNVVVTNLKGGVGKTTTAVYLSAAAAETGYDPVVLIDTDRQASSAEWLEERSLEGVTIVEAPSERTLTRAVNIELQGVTRWLGFLATTAAATPFIGLFGTVWGIMQAFNDIGLQGSTSIVAVAPGIAEALINTAAGLAAAIPALITYNYFSQYSRRLRMRMEDFSLEFLNLAERNFT